MNRLEQLAAQQGLMGEALRQSDRELGLAQVQALGGLARIDGDGFRIAALMVARLRFERALQGSVSLGASFERDPEALVQSFKRYHDACPMRATSPQEEAAGFEAWLQAQG